MTDTPEDGVEPPKSSFVWQNNYEPDPADVEKYFTPTERENVLRGHGVRGELKRRKFLELRQLGFSNKEACAEVQWQQSTYERMRKRWPEWRAQLDMIRLAEVDKTGLAHQENYTGGFGQFRKIFFGHDSPSFHLEIIRHLEYGKPGSLTLILLPPEHGKTTCIEDFANYKLGLDPTFRITVGSEGQPHARKILRRVKGRMETPSAYVARYGPFAPATGDDRKARQPWGADFFDVYKKQDHDERDFSMVALGWRSAIAGTRTDLMIVDDIQSRKSLSQSQEMFEVFRQDWLSRPGAKGRTVVLGTRVGPGDFYELLLDNDLVDNLVCIPAMDANGKYLWPERYTDDEYKKMRKNVGEEAWWRNYMQQPRVAGDQCFLGEYVDSCKNEYKPVGEYKVEDGITVLSLDPALGGGNSLTVTQFGRSLKILDQITDYNLARTEQILNRIQEAAIRYRPSYLIIERNAFQKGLARDDRLLTMSSSYGFRLLEHQTHLNKRDETFGVASMAQDFARQLIEIPWADDPITRARMEPLVSELEAWRADVPTRKIRQDRVMSLWFAWLRWRQMGAQQRTHAKPITTKGSPFGKTSVGRRVLQGSGRVW